MLKKITKTTINNSVVAEQTDQGVRLTPSFWYVKYRDSVIKLSHLKGDTEVGMIRGGLSMTDKHTALVETINISPDQQGKGLGKLLVAAFLAYWNSRGVSKIQLGTTDTSGGFWSKLGVSQSNRVMINDVLNKVYKEDSIFVEHQ
jgi:N-acetylglutamate synthase-like GNAT family acetyltransferase